MFRLRKENMPEIAALLLGGNIVILPTETSYGLGCDATNQQAVDRIFAIKNRPSNNPLLIIVPDTATAKKYLVWNNLINELARNYWPGPLTIVGQYKGSDSAQGVAAKDNTIAIRVPADPWLKELCQKVGRPIIATSANISGTGDVYDARVVEGQFTGREHIPDAIVDAGTLPYNPPTTIVSATEGELKILRQGALVVEKIKKKKNWLQYFFIIAVAIAASIAIVYFWRAAVIDIENNTRLVISFFEPRYERGAKNPLKTVKGLYLTAYSAGSVAKINEIIDLIRRTELNAVVIDIKDYSGLILYDSQLSLVNELGTKDDRLGDVRALINKLHDNRIYVIARQTIFQDPVLAEKKPEWAIKKKSGGVWRDKKGLAWVDPTRKEVWEYNLAVAKEAIKFGFDEINFDYVRFPSDGNMSEVVYTVGDSKKYEIMGEFYRFMSRRLSAEPVWLSLDLFGFVMEKNGEDDMNIGQRLADTVENADYVCPMMYPSHYPAGHLGLANPAEYPALVFENGFEKGMPKVEGHRAKVRPWLQAFNLGAVYDAEKIRAQIAVAEKYSSAGWLLWNASNRYTDAGLNK
ncbi:MAG: L-threonylcarbamoyladenylate synthase [Candidatus Magasanikbacteria bacterium]|nr:L-threonylcarbamoyladenylate synthase [Candidatus Magasanikbacteria bacterium]